MYEVWCRQRLSIADIVNYQSYRACEDDGWLAQRLRPCLGRKIIPGSMRVMVSTARALRNCTTVLRNPFKRSLQFTFVTNRQCVCCTESHSITLIAKPRKVRKYSSRRFQKTVNKTYHVLRILRVDLFLYYT